MIYVNLATPKPKIQAGLFLSEVRTRAREYLKPLVDSALLDVDLLLGYACSLNRLDVLTRPHHIISETEAVLFEEAILRRAKGEPVAYILGNKEFYGLTFEVNSNVLIPRPDSELLVDEALKFINGKSLNVIDVCTGSGCVALSIAKNAPLARVIGIDICEKALSVARRNAERLSLSNQVELRLGNLLTDASNEKCDLIVANPPYIRPNEIPDLMRDVKDFEPKLALIGKDEDGLGLHRELLSQSFDILGPNGNLMMEIGHNQALILSKMTFPGFSKPEFMKDYLGVLRVVKYSRLPSQLEEVFDG